MLRTCSAGIPSRAAHTCSTAWSTCPFSRRTFRSTAIALGSLMRDSSAESLVRPTVRWLLNARKNGRWGNTQENALAMEALVAYYKKYESEIPDFRAVVKLAGEEIARDTFQGRSSEATLHDVPMTALAAKAAPGSTHDLSFAREGTGTLFYIARLRYAADRLYQQGFDSGFRIERSYAPYVESGASPPARLDERAPLRGGHRSAAGRLRAGGVVVCDDGGRPQHGPEAGASPGHMVELVAAWRIRSRGAPR